MGRPWERFELTQSHDVETWVQDPSRITSIQPNLRHFLDLIGEKSVPDRPPSVLDVGCFAGYLLDYLRRERPGLRLAYTGVDVQPAAMRGAAQLHAGDPEATFRLAGVFNLAESFPAASFDFVFCARVLIHLPFFERAMEQLASAARVAAVVVLHLGETSWCRKILETGTQSVYFFRSIAEEQVRSTADRLGVGCRILKDEPYSTVILTRD